MRPAAAAMANSAKWEPPVPAGLEERVEAGMLRDTHQPVVRWRLVGTGVAARVDDNVTLRAINDRGHLIELVFSAADWAHAVGAARTRQPRKHHAD